MKKSSFFLFAVLLTAGSAAFAQKGVMMGKVLGPTGKPVAGADIKITGNKTYYKVKTDKDGMYHTPLIEPISYHVLIDADGKYYKTEKVKMAKPCADREFYNFVLAADHAELRTVQKDPAMTEMLEKIEEDLSKTPDTASYHRDIESEAHWRPGTTRREERRAAKEKYNASSKGTEQKGSQD